jgi:hypothetical protein
MSSFPIRLALPYLLGMNVNDKSLHTLIALADFKAVVGIDDRDDKLTRFCLVTSTLTIEQHGKRRFLNKNILSKLHITAIYFFPCVNIRLLKFPPST